MDSPKVTSCSPNSSISFSPAKKPATPPELGNAFARSDNAFPASTDCWIPLVLIPATVSPYSFIALPKGTNFSANSSISFSPAKKPATPPLLGSTLASSAIDLPASTDCWIPLVLIPATVSPYSFTALPKGTSCSPKDDNDEPPVSHEVIPSINPAPVSISIVSAKAFTALVEPSSNPLIAVKNGCILSINCEIFVPISGNPADTPPKKPPTIFPKNEPSP